MRIAVMGAGAVGGYFGARLVANSNEVAFIARGPHLTALRRGGLTVETFQKNLHIRDALFTDDLNEVGPMDLILFCVKSYDTEPVAQSLGPMMGPETVILSLQNGVDNADKIARLWGNHHVLAGVVYIASQSIEPGRIKHSAGGKIVFGAQDGQAHMTAEAVERLLSSAEISCEVNRDIRAVQWRKLLWNAPFCAISCLTRATVGEIVESDSLTKLALACMAEVREAATTQAIDLSPALFGETLQFSKGLGDFKPSMLQDLEAGKPLEFEAFNGIVVNLLQRAGKQAPTNQVFYSALSYLDERVRAQESPRES
ncbi:MAG TPA: 2-dehydropantoate 2-reductase [Candidatus Binatia bacterium]|nr:2-dehydropantoate 2-reductase [Candidatus Binatia bacterium]